MGEYNDTLRSTIPNGASENDQTERIPIKIIYVEKLRMILRILGDEITRDELIGVWNDIQEENMCG